MSVTLLWASFVVVVAVDVLLTGARGAVAALVCLLCLLACHDNAITAIFTKLLPGHELIPKRQFFAYGFWKQKLKANVFN